MIQERASRKQCLFWPVLKVTLFVISNSILLVTQVSPAQCGRKVLNSLSSCVNYPAWLFETKQTVEKYLVNFHKWKDVLNVRVLLVVNAYFSFNPRYGQGKQGWICQRTRQPHLRPLWRVARLWAILLGFRNLVIGRFPLLTGLFSCSEERQKVTHPCWMLWGPRSAATPWRHRPHLSCSLIWT